jgi:hypothetical protein
MRSLPIVISLATALTAPAGPDVQLFDYDAKAPLNFQDTGVKGVSGISVHDITYASPRGGNVPAYLVVPSGEGPFPGIIFVHWGQGNRTEFLSEALLLARAGAESLLIDGVFIGLAASKMTSTIPREKNRDTFSWSLMFAVAWICCNRAARLIASESLTLGIVTERLGAAWLRE